MTHLFAKLFHNVSLLSDDASDLLKKIHRKYKAKKENLIREGNFSNALMYVMPWSRVG
jgi:hypothetical protein